MLVTIGIGLTTAAAAALGRAHWQRQCDANSLSEARDALGICGQLLKMAGHLQQHRGMSTAWLAGDTSFQSRVAGKRNDVFAVIAELSSAAAQETERDYPCFTTQDLARFRFKWQSLTEGLKGLSPEQSIARHSQMIAKVLDWLAAYGEARIKLPAAEYLPSGSTLGFCQRLPSLTETLGQARAIGMGVAARGGCRPMARVRLMFLTTRAESLLQQSARAGGLGLAGEQARIAVQDMVKVIRCDMLADSGVTIGTDRYFELATAAIDSVFVWIDECGVELASALHPASERPLMNFAHGPDRQESRQS